MASLLNLLAYRKRSAVVEHECFEFLIKIQPDQINSVVKRDHPIKVGGNSLTILTQGDMKFISSDKDEHIVEIKTFKLLLDSGINPNQVGCSNGKTPLFYLID